MSDSILKALLDNMSDRYDKRPGHLVHDFMVPVSHQIGQLSEKIAIVENKLDIRNLSSDELDMYVEQSSDIKRHQASFAYAFVKVTGNCSFSKDDIVETPSGVQFKFLADETVSSEAVIKVQAVVAGAAGNVRASTLTQTPVTVSGLISITNEADAINGFDEEDDSHLIQRFLESEKEEVTSGNKAQLRSMTMSVQGVGNAKVFPLQNAEGVLTDNSALIIIVDSNLQPASVDLVNTVQEVMNPLATNGHGEGLAPMGCFVYVKSASAKNLAVTFNAVLGSGVTNSAAVSAVTIKINEYLKEAYTQNSIISTAKIGAAILSTEGIEDYSNLQINGSTANITVADKEVAVVQSVVIS